MRTQKKKKIKEVDNLIKKKDLEPDSASGPSMATIADAALSFSYLIEKKGMLSTLFSSHTLGNGNVTDQHITLLTKTTAARNGVALSYRSVRGL